MSEPDVFAPSVEFPEPPAPRRSPRALLAISAGVGMLVGALIATGTVLILTRGENRFEPEYAIVVNLRPDTTEEEKAEVKSALSRLKPVGEIEYETREQAFRRLKESFKDHPELLATLKLEGAPESFTANVADPEFTCSRMDPVKELAAVDEFQVIQKPKGQVLPATVGCY